MKGIVGLSALLLLLMGCSESEENGENVGGNLAEDAGWTIPLAEDTTPSTTGEDGVQGTDVGAGSESSEGSDVLGSGCGELCASELCDEATQTCYQCNNTYDCDVALGEWCNNKECVQTLCVPGALECKGATTVGECTDDGEAWEESLCDDGQFCAYGECKEPICEPGEVQCAYQQKKVCDSTGTSWAYVACPPGFGCEDGECTALKNNVVVIMDTSGSMAAADFGSILPGGGTGSCQDDSDCASGESCCESIFGGAATCEEASPLCFPPGSGGGLGGLDSVACVCGTGNCNAEPFPFCESLECPLSKLGLAKHTLAELINGGEFDAAHVVLTRFPQEITPVPSLQCGIELAALSGEKRGWYMSSGMALTGDNGQHITIAGDYFDNHLHEVLSVPFPKTAEEDTLTQLYAWIDGDETMEPSSQPCTGNNECPGGFCGESGGANVCHFHGSPELRALGGTPLGPALFYAGEYIRRHVVVDGKLCETDADCGNVNYFCNPDTLRCFDPLAGCRQTAIVLLSDGVGEEETDAFFVPSNVSKRLRYGLGCADDLGCNQGSSCIAGTCQGYPLNETCGGSESDACPQGSIGYTDSGSNVNQLYGYDGAPIQVTTNTIFIHNPGESGGMLENQKIADHGGGLFFDVATDDPSGLLDAINSILDVKENISQCVPILPDSLKL